MSLDKDFKSLMWFMAKMLAVFATLYVLLNLFTCNLNDYKYRNLEVVNVNDITTNFGIKKLSYKVL